jgi:protein SCO1
MNRRPRIFLLAIATVVVLAFALAVIIDRPATRSAAGTSASGAGASVVENARSSSGFDGALLPPTEARNFTLTDQLGRRVSLSQYRGQVTILTFLSSTCHPTCPLIAQQIRGALDELGEAGGHTVPVLIVSADPAADTPARVRRFLSEAALDERVKYLTGTQAELQPIWRAYDIVPAQLGNADSPHAASVLLIDRAGQKRDLFQVEQLTPEALAHDIRKLDGDPTHP